MRILLAEKSYPRSEQIPDLISATTFVMLSSTVFQTAEAEPLPSSSLFYSVMCSAPELGPLESASFPPGSLREPSPIRPPLEAGHLELVNSIHLCETPPPLIERTLASAREAIRTLPLIQNKFVQEIKGLNGQIATCPKELLNSLQTIKQFDTNTYQLKVVETLNKYRALQKLHSIIHKRLTVSRHALANGVLRAINEETILTLERLRFPTSPIQEFRNLLEQCRDNIRTFEAYQAEVTRTETQFKPVLDLALKYLKWGRGETDALEDWTYNIGLDYYYLKKWIKELAPDLPSNISTSSSEGDAGETAQST